MELWCADTNLPLPVKSSPKPLVMAVEDEDQYYDEENKDLLWTKEADKYKACGRENYATHDCDPVVNHTVIEEILKINDPEIDKDYVRLTVQISKGEINIKR